jgi:hypothetical protein
MGVPITVWCPVHMNVPDPKMVDLHMGLKTQTYDFLEKGCNYFNRNSAIYGGQVRK